MTTSPESIIAYYNIENLEERQERVYRCIANSPRMSSNDISRATKMQIGNVRNRVSELLAAGRIKICGKKQDRFTKRTVRQYVIVESEIGYDE